MWTVKRKYSFPEGQEGLLKAENKHKETSEYKPLKRMKDVDAF
jgi:hypothetical protein